MHKFKYLYFLLSIGAWALSHGALAANAPRFELDKAWPRLPENFRFGDVSSIAIDAQDNVWVLHRPRTLQGEAAKQAAFDHTLELIRQRVERFVQLPASSLTPGNLQKTARELAQP